MEQLWKGRFDGNDEADLRLWQVVKDFDPSLKSSGMCFVGYNTDDGVKRNFGRPGAKDGSNAIRAALQSLPNIENLHIYDYKNLSCEILEDAQKEYAGKIKNVIHSGLLPIGLGGSHDIAYGSYLGIRSFYTNETIGIINFDAHLDMRPYENGGTSGTSFKQILDSDSNAKYAIVGFKRQGNTKRLLDTAKKYNVLLFDEEEVEIDEKEVIVKLKAYINTVDIVYITFCMDVFDAAQAPGVSAPTVMGLDPKKAKRIVRELFKTDKVVCADFAEVNPIYDVDNRTAKLAGALIYDIMLHRRQG